MSRFTLTPHPGRRIHCLGEQVSLRLAMAVRTGMLLLSPSKISSLFIVMELAKRMQSIIKRRAGH
jgi:hypothetical protein